MEEHLQKFRSKQTRVAGEREGRWGPVIKGLGCLTREPSKDPLEGCMTELNPCTLFWRPVCSEEGLASYLKNPQMPKRY